MPNPRKPRTFIPSKYTRYTVYRDCTSTIDLTCVHDLCSLYMGACFVLTVRITKIAIPDPASSKGTQNQKQGRFNSLDHSEVIKAACPQAIR